MAQKGYEDTARVTADVRSKYLAEAGPRYEVEVGAVSDRGLKRDKNEDHFAIIQRRRGQRVLHANLDLSAFPSHDDRAHLLMVTDGVGGEDFGEIASELAIRLVWQLADQLYSWVMKLVDIERQFEEIRERVAVSIETVQSAFESIAESAPKTKSMGTTVTAAYVMGPDGIVINLGDSRAYLYRDGVLTRETRDHTLAQDWIDAGAKPEEVRRVRNVLTRCLSAKSTDTTPDIHYLRFEPGDRLLLCTDGLSDLVDDESIAAELGNYAEPQEAAERLLQLALDRGGKDNITIVVAAIKAPPWVQRRSP